MKKYVTISLMLLTISMAVFAPSFNASALTITANDYGLNNGGGVLINESNVAAGFEKDYPVTLKNNASFSVGFSLAGTNLNASSKLLDASYFELKDLDGNIVSSGNYLQIKNQDLTCLEKGQAKDYILTMKINHDLDNSYQGLGYNFDIIFYSHQNIGCGLSEEIEVPNTGER